VKTDVTFTASLGLVSSTAPLSVFPEGPASVSLNPPALNGGQPSVGTITLTGPAPAGGMVVTLSCNNKDATIPPSVKVEAATTTATFNIKTVKIAVPVAATITARYGTQIQTAVLSIAPPGISSMVLNPASVTGTAPAGVTLILAEPAPAGGLRIVLSCDQPAATVPAQIVIPSGKTTASFTVRTVGVPAQLVVNVKAMIGNVPKLAPLTILPPSLLSLILETPVVDGGNGSGGVVTISSPAPPVGLIVTLASNQKGAAPPVNVTIPAGRTSASFSIKTTKVTAQTMATITATFGGTSQTATLTIN